MRQYKNWWITLVLGLLMPGFGHIYNHQWKKGLFLVLNFHLFSLTIATITITQFHSQMAYLIALSLIILLWVIIVFEGVFAVYRKRVPLRDSIFDQWYSYVLLFLLLRFGFSIPLMHYAESRLVHFYAISSESMISTIHPGDQIVADVHTVRQGYIPRINDIFTFKNVIDKDAYWVKRVVALSGDTISLKQRALFNNNKLVPPPHSAIQCNDTSVVCNLNYTYALPKKGETFNVDTLSPQEFLFLYNLIRQENRKSMKNAELYVYANDLLVTSWDLDSISHLLKLESLQRKQEQNLQQATITYKPQLFFKSSQPVTSYTIKENCYFLAGDNRPDSYDSRLFGPVSHASLTGKVRAIYLSFTVSDPKNIRFNLFRTGQPLE